MAVAPSIELVAVARARLALRPGLRYLTDVEGPKKVMGPRAERTDLGDAPTITRGRLEPRPARLSVVVVGDSIFATFPLPQSGEVTIGRSDKNDIRIDDPSVSREHAILEVGEGLSIRDLGSANGSAVDKQRLLPNQPVRVLPDHLIEVGSTMLIIQRTALVRPKRLSTHDHFEARVEDECERAAKSKRPFVVLRLHTTAGVEASSSVLETLAEDLGPTDLVAAYGPGEYEVLLAETTLEQAQKVLTAWIDRLAETDIELRGGLAAYPACRTPEELIAEACDAVRPGNVGATTRAVILEDDSMRELYKLVTKIGAGSISVVLLGETGVGKEVVAETLHRRSPRRARPFLRLNCAALSETLLESELFGHEKGSFTGAHAAKPGLLETAEGGTVFLDEVGELPLGLQVKLLRVIEEKKVMRVGALSPRPIDVRFVAATNRDLESEVLRGTFRADLYFRLNGISLVIPPLRERPAEIEPLARAFIEAAAAAGSARPPKLAEGALGLLHRYSWPGNIRELKNVMERAVLLCDGEIRAEHLPVEKMRATLLAPSASKSGDFVLPKTLLGSRLDETTQPPVNAVHEDLFLPGTAEAELTDSERKERRQIIQALERCGGNQTQAAKVLGISRRTLVSRLDKYEVPRPRKPQS